jgi:protein-disulfide isomerase
MNLDIDRFRKEMLGHVYASLIDKSIKSGIDSHVEGTPTFFVNNIRYGDSWDLKIFSNNLQMSLTK